MAEVTTVNVPQGDFVTTTLNGAISNSATSFTIGTGLSLDANGGFLQINYDSVNALGASDGPETVAYTGYNTGTGAVTGVTRAQSATTAVSHSNGATVACGTSAKYFLNGNVLGYAERTSDFTDSTSTGIGTLVDITSLSVAVTVPAGGRRVKITGYARQQQQDTGAAQLLLFIREGSTNLNVSAVNMISTSAACQAFVQYVGVPAAGSHTYKLSYSKSAAGGYTLTAGATNPAFILVELI